MDKKKPSKEKKQPSPWWPWVIVVVVLLVLAGIGIVEHREVVVAADTEKANLKQELGQMKNRLILCELKPSCDKKKHAGKPKTHRNVVSKPPPPQPKAEKISLNSKACGKGTEAMISKATGRLECRPISAPTPTVVKTEASKVEVKCEKPLIRLLREDGTIACTSIPQFAQQTTAPPGCFMDGPRIMLCPVEEEASYAVSWVPWVIVGAVATLAVAANNRHGSHRSLPAVSPPPTITTLPPVLPPKVITTR